MSFGDLKVQDLIYEDSSNNEITVVIADLATKANPVFSGTVTVPTATAGDNSTKAASTAFVVASFAPKNAPAFTGSATGVNLTLSGDLTVNGTTTTINTTTLQVEDKNIEIGKVSSPSDTTADGGGWTLLGSTSKTFNWLNATDSWTSSEHIEIASGKNLKVDGTTFFVDGTNNRVGIGTTSPAFELHVGGSGQQDLLIGSTNAGGARLILDGDSDGDGANGDFAEIVHTTGGDLSINARNPASNAEILISSNGSERMRIDQYGRALLGTTTAGEGSADDLTIATTDGSLGQTGITIRSGTSAGGQIYFADGTSGDDRQRGIISYQHGGNYMRFYTNASERLRITEDGAIGIGGATYGTSGQVLTSGGSGAAPSWTTMSAAPEVTLTASEAITAEDAIMVKTNGQAEKITGVISGMGSISTTFGTGPSTYDFDDHATIGYDENTDKYVCVFYNQNDSRKLYGMVGTQSGGNIVWGNASEIFSGVGDTDPPKQRIALVYVSSLQKLAYFYRNNSNNGYTRGGYLTVTGTGTSATVANLGGNTFGNPNTAAYSAAYTNSGNHGLVIAYAAGNNGRRPRVMKVNINSTSSMTDTSELDVTSSNQGDYSCPDILWSASNNLYSICFKNLNSKPACKNLSYASWGVSPGTNTGTEISTDSIESECGPKIAWSSVDNKHLAIWPQYNTDKIRGVIYTASGSSISAGTTFDISPAGIGTPRRANLYSVTYNATANRFFVTYAYRNANGTFLKVLKYNSSTNQCDIESTTTIQSSERAFFIDNCNNPDDNRVGIVYNNESGEAGRITCYTPDNSNMDPARFVGFAKASVSSGAEVTVKVSSNTSTRSGLTPASTYYVLGDGSIGTTAAPTGTIKAGLALTSTKLLINRDNES
jgi:hypothetical protein